MLNRSADHAAAERAFMESREAYVRVTVVRAERPTSAHAGDTALLDAAGTLHGFVGGNCVQGSVREYGLQALASGEPLLLRVLPGEPRRTAGEGAVEVSNPCLSGGAVELFLQPQVPAPRLLVVGNTPVARALAALGRSLDLDVELADSGSDSDDDSDGGGGGTAEPSADHAAVIVASHGRDEEPALTAALNAGVPYVALVASRRRAESVLASLDVDDAARGRVHSPAGLALGARTPAETALAILAEFTALRRATPGMPPAPENNAASGRETVAGHDAAPGAGGEPTREPAPGQAVDPVCGMDVVISAGTPRVEADGVLTYFCCPGCRAAYLRDPDRYATIP